MVASLEKKRRNLFQPSKCLEIQEREPTCFKRINLDVWEGRPENGQRKQSMK